MKINEHEDFTPLITAAVCTHNDGHYIKDVVESLMNQTLSPTKYECLIIDNENGPESLSIIDELFNKYPDRLRVIKETQLGLSYARNRALSSAKAPFVTFVDADAIADKDLLKSVLYVFNSHPRAGIVGGAIFVRWDYPKPIWWKDDELDEAMGHYSPSDCIIQLGTNSRTPNGGNYSVRVSVNKDTGYFITSLGRMGRKLWGGEENEFSYRAIKAGWEVWFTPEALIHHRPPAIQATRRRIVKRAFYHGRSKYLIEKLHDIRFDTSIGWFSIFKMIFRRLIRLKCDLLFVKRIASKLGYIYQHTLER